MSPNCIVGLIPHLTHTEEEPNALSPEEVHSFLAAIRDRYPQHLRWHADRLPAGPMRESELLFPSETGGFRSAMVLDKPFKDVCQHLALGKTVTARAMRRTFQDHARRASIDGLIQRSICGHLTEEMTERYSSVAQVEVEAALGKVVSLSGYRDLLRFTAPEDRGGGKVVGKPDSPLDHRTKPTNRRNDLAFTERDIGFEPTTFSLGS